MTDQRTCARCGLPGATSCPHPPGQWVHQDVELCDTITRLTNDLAEAREQYHAVAHELGMKADGLAADLAAAKARVAKYEAFVTDVMRVGPESWVAAYVRKHELLDVDGRVET